MTQAYARTMFGEAAKKYQGQHGSRAQYERAAERGEIGEALSSKWSRNLLRGGTRSIWRA